jgi:hypothetical protein
MATPDYQTLMLPVLTFAAESEARFPLAAQTIADRLGLSGIERMVKNPTITVVERVATALGCRIGELLN